MAISEFRMKKFMYLFNVFFDTNRSGSIDKKDFDMAAQTFKVNKTMPTNKAHRPFAVNGRFLRHMAGCQSMFCKSCMITRSDTCNYTWSLFTNICKVRGWAAGDANFENTKVILNNVWRGLQEKADADKDEEVTCEEWCQMWEEYSRDPGAVLDWQVQFRDFMFNLEDTSGDGAIDEEEFVIICSSYKIPEQNARDAFKKLSSGGSVEITREKFADLWVEYFQSDDPSSPGNFIFGVTRFE